MYQTDTETVTVDQALKKGANMRIPCAIVFIAAVAITFYLQVHFSLPGIFIAVGFIAGLFLGWLYWCFMVTKWRLWAFENVRNVHELKKRAIKANLIGEDGGFSERTEIRNAAQKEQWGALQQKFDREDVFIDDSSVADETLIHFSKSKTRFEFVLYLALFCGGAYLGTHQNTLIGIILCGIGGWLAYKEYKEMTNPDPQIILNTKGIQTASTQFYDWNEIQNEDAIMVQSGKYSHEYLVYDNPSGSEKLDIAELETNVKDLGRLLRVYRGRHDHQKTGQPRQNSTVI